jgi:hypothetical protein
VPTDTLVSLNDMLFSNPLVHPSVMFRTQAIAQLGGYDAALLAEDYDLWIRAAASGARIKIVAAPLLRYRIHGAQISYRVTGMKSCAQIASTIRRFALAKAPLRACLATCAWLLRGAALAVWARLRKARE